MTSQKQPPTGTHWRQVHKRPHAHLLYAEDIGSKGTTIDVEIIDSGIFMVKGIDGEKEMPWLAFRGAKKRLGLNPTNCKAMVSMTGSPIVETWRGWITLTVVETEYRDTHTKRKELTDAIRIAPRRPNKTAPQPKAEQQQPTVGEKAVEPTTNPLATPAQEAAARERWGDGDGSLPPLSIEEQRAIEMAEKDEANRGQ